MRLKLLKYSNAVNIILLHKNLRLSDNPALYFGCKAKESIIIYIYDKNYWRSNGKSQRQFKFCLDCLSDLEQKLNELNRDLYVFEGDLVRLAKWINKNFPQSKIFLNQSTDIGYYKDQHKKFIKEFSSFKRLTEYEDFGIQTKNHNRDNWSSNWHKIMNQNLVPPPDISSAKRSKPSGLITFESFKKTSSAEDLNNINIQLGGENEAKKLLMSFLEKRVDGYSSKMSSPSEAEYSCSRLSPHITFGTLSIKTIFQEVQKRMNSSPFRKDLYSFKKRLHWHCHFIQKLETEPELEFKSMHSMCDSLREKEDKELVEKWISGETGFPFLDACMTYLKQHGWINFRMRAMIMSFASYNLWQPWQETSPRLAELFVDYEPGIHICQVQMQSGVTGINLPRIYSVLKQSSDQDPSAIWIKSQINSLKNIDPKNIHEAELNEIYHKKIIDLNASAKKARDTIWSARKGSDFKRIARDVYLKHGSRLRRA